MSNRVLRKYYDHQDLFMRATFHDDNLENIRNMAYITKNLYRKYLNEIKLLDRRLINFGWSAS